MITLVEQMNTVGFTEEELDCIHGGVIRTIELCAEMSTKHTVPDDKKVEHDERIELFNSIADKCVILMDLYK